MVFTRLLRNWKDLPDLARRERSAHIGADATGTEHPAGAARASGAGRGAAALVDDLYASLERVVRKRDARKGPAGGDLVETGHPLDAAIEDLRVELGEVVRAIREEFDGRLENPFRGLSLQSGKLPRSGAEGYVPFLFLRVPGIPGFLLEPKDEETVEVYRATEARTLLNNESTGAVEWPAIFSRRSGAVLLLKPLEPGLWRVLRTEVLWDTKSTSSVAEALAARAVQELGVL